MKLKRLLSVLLLCVCYTQMYGQWDAQISQYWRTKTYFNPSFAGETDNLQAVVLHRQQWVGVQRAPKSFIISADMPINFLNKTHGVGLLVMTESIGLFSNTSMGAQYVFKKKWKKNTLNIGVQGGMSSIGFDASKIHLVSDEAQMDEALPTSDEQSSAFDANLGVSWVTPKYYVGLSLTHLTEPSFDFGDNSSSYISRTYYFTAGGNIPFKNPLYELQPSILIKSDAVVTQYDVTARLEYNKTFNGGVSWRKDDGFVFMLGIKIKGIDAGYAYDLSTSEISKVSDGTHEFFVRYSMPLNLSKGEKNRRKAIRIL